MKLELETVDLKDVEIWSAGTFNGDTYTESDLDDMANNHAEIGAQVKPFVKLGHDKEQQLLQKDGYPAAGWIQNVRRQGSKLYADFTSVPKKIAELIGAKAYGRFSPEIIWNMKDGDKVRRRVLSAVSLLGANTPANLTLTDFINLYEHYKDADVHSYETAIAEINQEVNEMSEDNSKLEIERLKAELAEKEAAIAEAKKYASEKESELNDAHAKIQESEVKRYAAEVDSKFKEYAGKKLTPAQEHAFKALAMAEISGKKEYSFIKDDAEQKISYSSALELVSKFVDTMPELNLGKKTEYTSHSEMKAVAEMPEGQRADELLDRKVKKYMKEQKVTSYSEALDAVLSMEDN